MLACVRTASCTCGQLKATCDGDPVRVSICHCLNCQRRSGSVFAVQARWPADRVTIEGTASEYTLTGDEGSKATFRFCPTCGATVYYDSDAIPAFIMTPVGTFADPTFPPPTVAVYTVRRHAWARTPDLDAEELD